jgi:ferric iron reductase protein FhuF
MSVILYFSEEKATISKDWKKDTIATTLIHSIKKIPWAVCILYSFNNSLIFFNKYLLIMYYMSDIVPNMGNRLRQRPFLLKLTHL